MLPDVAGLHAAIEDTGRAIADSFDGRYLSILLLGSAARGEITIDARGEILSDLDFLIVLPQTSMATALLEMHRCRPRLQTLHSRLAQSPFRHVSLGLAHAVPRYWAVATPLMWELRATARVLYGSAAVKEWPAVQTAGNIPQWEGIRLIANRMCELLDILGAKAGPRSVPESLLSYACVKAVLACSEGALIDEGRYAATYRERWQRHADVAERFIDRQNSLVEMAYRVKLGQDTQLPFSTEPSVRETLHLVLATLAQFGITAPQHFARRAREESCTAPGFEQDTLYCATQALRCRRVPLRRPITAVYADAYRATASMVQSGGGGSLPTARCRRVASRYRACPQMVVVVPNWNRSRSLEARTQC